MGLQKFRADYAGEKQSDGAIPYYTKWVGGPTLALIRNCPVDINVSPRTVYATGHADTYFSIPAACRYKGKIVRGYIATNQKDEYIFHAYRLPSPYMANPFDIIRKSHQGTE